MKYSKSNPTGYLKTLFIIMKWNSSEGFNLSVQRNRCHIPHYRMKDKKYVIISTNAEKASVHDRKLEQISHRMNVTIYYVIINVKIYNNLTCNSIKK
jgi:hypothetical protein